MTSNSIDTKFTMEVPSPKERSHSKFEENSFKHSQDTNNQTFKKMFFFAHLQKLFYSRMRASIWLKFGTQYWGSTGKFQHHMWGKSDKHSNNLICKSKSNFCHTYRVNCFEEQLENHYEARLNIRRVPLVVRN